MPKAIAVHELFVRYRNRQGALTEAVRGLTFDVEPGEVVGFLGPNGAGKSSTLKTLMGFVEPSAGECRLFDQPAGSLAAKAKTGYLPEIANYYPYLTPVETLVLYGELQGLKGNALREETHHLLHAVGLEKALRKQNRQLSKGMLQRVGIAQSLLGSPELLILDEVTSGLDPLGRRELRALLKERQEAGCTLFFSSHELGEVEMLCDRILLIDQGRLVEERGMDQLKEELRRFRMTYSGPVSMVGLSTEWREIVAGTFEADFHSRKGLQAAIERVQDKGGRILDVETHEASLEDYFVETIGRAA